MNNILNDFKLLKIDALSILIYYPFIRFIYFISKRFTALTPNVITIFGLSQFVFLSGMFLFFENINYLIVGIFFFTIMDVADGFVARKSRLSSRLGAALDLCSDRLVFFFTCFLIAFHLFLINASTLNWIGFSLYAFLFLYLDSLILIIDRINLVKNSNKKQHKIVGKWSFLTNSQFRFSSYMLICLWLINTNLIFLMMAVFWVLLEYAMFAIKSIKYLLGH